MTTAMINAWTLTRRVSTRALSCWLSSGALARSFSWLDTLIGLSCSPAAPPLAPLFRPLPFLSPVGRAAPPARTADRLRSVHALGAKDIFDQSLTRAGLRFRRRAGGVESGPL